MPPGWSTQFDQNSQRWYYVEQATGRTQWDPPAFSPPPQGPYAPPPPPGAPYGQASGHDERALFGNTHGGHDSGHGYGSHGDPYGHGSDPYGHGEKGQKEKKDKSKDKGHSTAMLAAAGIGGIAAGAYIGHELSKFMPHHDITRRQILIKNS